MQDNQNHSNFGRERFSDVVRRSSKKEMRLSDIAGSRTVSREDWKRVVKAFEHQRKIDEERRRRLLGLLGAKFETL